MNKLFKLILALALVFSVCFNAVGCELIGDLGFEGIIGGETSDGDSLDNGDNTDTEAPDGDNNGNENQGGNTGTETPDGDNTGNENQGGNTGTETPDGDNTGNENQGGNTGTETPDGDNTGNENQGGNTGTETPGGENTGNENQGGNAGTETPGKDSVTYHDVYVNAYGGFTVPAYSGKAYYVINNNQTFFVPNEIVTSSYERYDPLDSLGRVTLAMGCLGFDLMPTEPRGDISEVKPTGWNQANYSVISGGYLYNRCHMIAFQLTGENANRENLITGTAYFNKTMIPFENQIADYIKETKNHVMYRITPVFTGNNLLAEGIILEAYSVEDEGDGISFNLFIYNVQPKVDIDYATGKSTAIEPEDKEEVETPTTSDYVLNTNSMKVHDPDCRYADKIAEANREEYSGDLQDLLDQGYETCKVCNPK